MNNKLQKMNGGVKIKKSKLLVCIFSVSLFIVSYLLLVPMRAEAAVPTFDVGLNPKMDQLLVKTDTIINQMNLLLCMIAGIHQKEVGPPPTSTCQTAGFGGSGGATSPGTGGGLGGILGGLAGNILGGAIGQITGQLGSALGGQLGSALGGQLGNIFPSGLFDFMPGGSSGIPDITSLPPLDSIMGGVANIFGGCDSFDCIAWNISKAMLSAFSKQVVNWVQTAGVSNTGLTGQALFVRDWDRYLLDAANAASNVFIQELQATQLCEPFGTELKKIFSAGGGFSIGAISGGGFGGGIFTGSGGSAPFNQLLNCNLNSVTTNFQLFFDDFNNGGWNTWTNLISPEVNPFSNYMTVMIEKESREARAVQAARLEAESSDGFLGVKQCTGIGTWGDFDFDIDEGSGGFLGKDCPIVTPGILVEAEMRKVLESEVDQLNTADELDEILSVLLQQLLQGVLFSAGGLFSPAYGQNSIDPPPNFPPETTPAPPPPAGQPNITMISPTDGSYVTGTVQISATTANLPNVSSAQFSLERIVGGGNIGAPISGSGSFQTSLNTSTLADGVTYSIIATALNASSTSVAVSAPVSVTVDRTPPVVATPTINQSNLNNINGNRQLRVVASDGISWRGLTVVFYLGSQCIGANNNCDIAREGSSSERRYELNFDSRDYVNGTYAVTARVTDRAGNAVTSAPLTITINN